MKNILLFIAALVMFSCAKKKDQVLRTVPKYFRVVDVPYGFYGYFQIGNTSGKWRSWSKWMAPDSTYYIDKWLQFDGRWYNSSVPTGPILFVEIRDWKGKLIRCNPKGVMPCVVISSKP